MLRAQIHKGRTICRADFATTYLWGPIRGTIDSILSEIMQPLMATQIRKISVLLNFIVWLYGRRNTQTVERTTICGLPHPRSQTRKSGCTLYHVCDNSCGAEMLCVVQEAYKTYKVIYIFQTNIYFYLKKKITIVKILYYCTIVKD